MAATDPADFSARRGTSGSAAMRAVKSHGSKPPVIVAIFIITMLQPFYMIVGGTLFGMPRLFVLLAFVPVTFAFIQGRAGKIILPDYFMIAYALWGFVSAFKNHGPGMPANLVFVTALETCIPYMLARITIRNADHFRYFFRCLLWAVLYLLPFAIYEATTKQNLLVDIYSSIPAFNTFRGNNHEPRMGLYRADGTFEHPILYGLFCSIPFTMAWMGVFPNGAKAKRFFWTTVSLVATVMSVSSGALFSIIFQGALMSWDLMFLKFKKRWKTFAIIVAVVYLLAEILISSPPLLYFISHATLNASSAWNRVNIWIHGSANVWANPIFGLAYRPWVRPYWLLPSVDNYWLVVAMRGGVTGFLLHVVPIVWILVKLGRAQLEAWPEVGRLRAAYLITFGGLTLTLATVHIWSAVYMLIMFLIGAPVWMLALEKETPPDEAETEAAEPSSRRLPYSRFSGKTPTRGRNRAAMADSEGKTGPTRRRAPGASLRSKDGR